MSIIMFYYVKTTKPLLQFIIFNHEWGEMLTIIRCAREYLSVFFTSMISIYCSMKADVMTHYMYRPDTVGK